MDIGIENSTEYIPPREMIISERRRALAIISDFSAFNSLAVNKDTPEERAERDHEVDRLIASLVENLDPFVLTQVRQHILATLITGPKTTARLEALKNAATADSSPKVKKSAAKRKEELEEGLGIEPTRKRKERLKKDTIEKAMSLWK